MFKDFLGIPVNVGDYVFYSTTGRYAESRLVKVTRFTKQSVFGKIIKSNRAGMYDIDQEVIIKNDFVRLPEEHVLINYLK